MYHSAANEHRALAIDARDAAGELVTCIDQQTKLCLKHGNEDADLIKLVAHAADALVQLNSVLLAIRKHLGMPL